ncbi:tetratricopeptide repeat protein [Flavobacterium lacisediminis]|uniref:Tetratricopeptide repeat protein n=1 Tax=Flavobacterium lacisediminis TaxID=2989705 RepID=A0ABT3EDV0_9FLAO|nr:tetratricopeptide repeat protein [Flavobacterium lacisediminis]MCW1146757.1 tetratricopeptide repeat protein [Flavobacterium lacisediminis]
MLQKIAFFILFLSSFWVSAQNEQLAFNYIDAGEYEKAVTILEEVYSKNKHLYLDKLLYCYQQLQQYEKALKFINELKPKNSNPTLLVEEGYIYQLQKKQSEADKKYQEALNEIDKNANFAYNLGSIFERKVLLEWALKAYEKGQKLNPNLNFDYQTAMIQGQLGNLEVMLNKLLDYGFNTPDGTPMVQNQLTRYLMDDSDGSFAASIRKNLLLRTQKSQDVYWNQFLSWFFVQQKEYGKAFVQEKAVYKRNPDSFYNIVTLGSMAVEEKQFDDAKLILEFVLENTQDLELQMKAHHFLLSMEMESATSKEHPTIDLKLQELLKKYGISPYSLDLQILSAHFKTFYLNQSKLGIELLQNALKLPLNLREQAEVKMELADIMVYDEKFNQAILYYAQVEDNLKNDVLAHEASLKLAKANFYKKDFDWTLQQVKVLKQSPSLLIANDAIEMFLLLQDNSAEDSLRVALQAYAKADLQLYQNKKEEALQSFLTILQKHKGESIEESTLFKVGKIYEEKKDYLKALSFYQNILDNYKEGIYKDEALFFSAEIYRKYLLDNEKAKPLYEKMVLEHPDSLYYTESRKQYRTLRGDTTI